MVKDEIRIRFHPYPIRIHPYRKLPLELDATTDAHQRIREREKQQEDRHEHHAGLVLKSWKHGSAVCGGTRISRQLYNDMPRWSSRGDDDRACSGTNNHTRRESESETGYASSPSFFLPRHCHPSMHTFTHIRILAYCHGVEYIVFNLGLVALALLKMGAGEQRDKRGGARASRQL